MQAEQKDQLIERISADMRTALKNKDLTTCDALRSLLARISSAEAVPLEEVEQTDSQVTELPRKELDVTQIQAVIIEEIHELQDALIHLDKSSRYAGDLQEKITAIQKYL